MKRMLGYLMLLMYGLLLLSTAQAESATVVYTTIPDSHIIAVDCGQGGYVLENGVKYTGKFTITIDRLSDYTLNVAPNSQWTLDKITVDKLGGVEILGNTVVFSDIYEDKLVEIRFKQKSASGSDEQPAEDKETEGDDSPLNSSKPTEEELPEVSLDKNVDIEVIDNPDAPSDGYGFEMHFKQINIPILNRLSSEGLKLELKPKDSSEMKALPVFLWGGVRTAEAAGDDAASWLFAEYEGSALVGILRVAKPRVEIEYSDGLTVRVAPFIDWHLKRIAAK